MNISKIVEKRAASFLKVLSGPETELSYEVLEKEGIALGNMYKDFLNELRGDMNPLIEDPVLQTTLSLLISSVVTVTCVTLGIISNTITESLEKLSKEQDELKRQMEEGDDSKMTALCISAGKSVSLLRVGAVMASLREELLNSVKETLDDTESSGSEDNKLKDLLDDLNISLN